MSRGEPEACRTTGSTSRRSLSSRLPTTLRRPGVLGMFGDRRTCSGSSLSLEWQSVAVERTAAGRIGQRPRQEIRTERVK